MTKRERHGRTESAEYRTWAAMKRRCLNPNTEKFRYYGGRGITICDRWINSFCNFLADMGPRPTPKHTLDRINTDGHYEPANCRWVLFAEQMRNKRRNRRITYNGITLVLQDWARHLGVPRGLLRDRLNRGWSVEKAFTVPVGKIKPRATGRIMLTHNGVTMPLAEWARVTGIPYITLYARLYIYKWSISRSLS